MSSSLFECQHAQNIRSESPVSSLTVFCSTRGVRCLLAKVMKNFNFVIPSHDKSISAAGDKNIPYSLWFHNVRVGPYASIEDIRINWRNRSCWASRYYSGKVELTRIRRLQGVKFHICRNKDCLWGSLSNHFESEPVAAANNGWARIFAPRFPTWSNLKFLERVQCRSSWFLLGNYFWDSLYSAYYAYYASITLNRSRWDSDITQTKSDLTQPTWVKNCHYRTDTFQATCVGQLSQFMQC